MAFQPDVEKLIQPIRIVKPQEEFLLPGAAPSPDVSTDLPIPVVRDTPFAAPVSQLQALTDEAARVQDLMDILTETTPNIQVSIPEEDQVLLGAATVSTKDYLAAAADNSPNAVRLRHHFEWGLLQGCGSQSSSDWPVVAMPDLHSIQGDLMNAANTIEGQIFTQTPLQPATPADWRGAASSSHLAAVNETLIQGSRNYRLKLAQVTFTSNLDATSSLLQKIIEPMLSAQTAPLRPIILDIMNGMKALRNLLCHAGFLRAMEYRSVRDALLSLVESTILKQLLNAFLVILGQAENALISPVLNMLEHGLGNGSILSVLGDAAGQEIASVAGSTMLSIRRRYNDQAADLIRALDQKSEQQLEKLHVLGERNLINRWVAHLDAGILILRRALSQQANLSHTLAQSSAQQILQGLEAPQSPLLDRLSQHPELSVAMGTRLFNREFTPIPLNSLSGQVQGSFGDLHLTTPDFQVASEVSPAAPSFTGVDAAGQQNRVS